MKEIANRMSPRTRIRLYKFLYTLNEMDFSFLRPVILGCLLIGTVYIKKSLPEEYINNADGSLILMYRILLVFLTLSFLYFLRPHIKRRIIRFKIWFNRRKKRAAPLLFL